MPRFHARPCGILVGFCACSADAQVIDGPAIGWGNPNYYRATQNDPQSPLPPIPAGRFKAVSAGFNFTLYLVSSNDPLEDGTILFRGHEHPQLNQTGELRDHIPEGYGYKAISAGYAHCLAIDRFDHMRAWGDIVDNNLAGEVPIELRAVPVSAIAAGEHLNAALRADRGHEGELVTWGRSEAHVATMPYETIVVPGGESRFSEISAHGHHIVARTVSGRLFTWGAQLRDPNGIPYDQGQVGRFNETPLDPQNRPWGSFCAGHWHTVVLDQDGVWHEYDPGNPIGLKWGQNGCGQSTRSCTTPFACQSTYRPPPCTLPAFVEIQGGYFHTTGRTPYGAVIPWGGAPAAPPAPYRIRQFSAKFDHGIGIQTCYANCDGSTTPPVLDDNDFTCFLNSYNSGDPTADCNGDGVLTVADFGCFQNKFAAGCTAP